MRKLTILGLVLALGGLCAAPVAQANGTIRDGWLANYPDVCELLINAANDCSLCHVEGFNPYGQDLADNNADFAAIESFDSDGDGRTNAQEILSDCTLPGDDTSVPNNIETWSHIKALFR